MKIEFSNRKDYIEISRQNGEVIFSISARNSKNPLQTQVLSASVSDDEFYKFLFSLFSISEIENIMTKIVNIKS